MARVQNTLIGKSSGSVGGATFSTWKGINVLKSKAISVFNPKTQAQENQRQRMALLVAFFRTASSAINIGFQKLAVKKSAYNAFIQENLIPLNFTGIAPNMTLEVGFLAISKGTIQPTVITSMTNTEGSANVIVNWDGDNIPVGASADDIAHVVVYNSDFELIGTNSLATRDDDTATVVLPQITTNGDNLYSWLYFENPISKEVSDSTSTSIVVA